MLYCLEILYICKVACQLAVGLCVLAFSFCLGGKNQMLKIARIAPHAMGTEEPVLCGIAPTGSTELAPHR